MKRSIDLYIPDWGKNITNISRHWNETLKLPNYSVCM